MSDDYEVKELRKAISELIPFVESLTRAVEGGIDLNQSTWEYDWATVSDGESAKGYTISLLDSFGEKGWEFTGYTESDSESVKYLMKRRLPE